MNRQQNDTRAKKTTTPPNFPSTHAAATYLHVYNMHAHNRLCMELP
jgi:hypothetical protein